MRVIPRSRRSWIAVAVVVVVVVASAPLWLSPAKFLFKLVFPDRFYEDAAERSSEPAAAGPAVPLPTTREGPAPTGTDPSIARREVAAIEGPSAVADPPGPGPVLLTTLAGEVRALDVATGDSEVVLDLASEISTGGERGLLGAAVDPEGERLYLDYTNTGGDTEIRSWPLEDGRPVGGPTEGVLHLRIGQPFPNHNGGHLVFGPDGALWIGTGDGGGAGDVGDVAQDPDSLLGKMLRVIPDPDGGLLAPTTNPDWDGRPEVWAIGLRNPWRYSFDRATDQLWIADVGQDSIEEVSVIDPEADRPNFGWNELEGNNSYEGEARPEFTAPVVTYGRDGGCSVTGGHVYRGAAVPGLFGWYLFADFCGGWVRAVPADDPEREPIELLSDLGPVIAFAELEDGELLVLTAEAVSTLVGP